MTWRLSSQGELYDCNESTVVYFDPASGNTHLLSDFAGYIIKELQTRPLGNEEISGRVAGVVSPSELAALDEIIPTLLRELEELDIVEAL